MPIQFDSVLNRLRRLYFFNETHLSIFPTKSGRDAVRGRRSFHTIVATEKPADTGRQALLFSEKRVAPRAQIASLSSFAGRNATFLLALIWICSPVAGLRPIRAARERTCRIPRPAMRTRSPIFR